MTAASKTTGRGRPPARKDAPRGEQQVRASLIAAATELFAERGPSSVSVREVAEAAGVNHGLVHHYFGSKDGLTTAVLDHLAAQATAEIATHEPDGRLYAPGGASERHGRIVAHLILEGRDPADYKSSFPSMQALVVFFHKDGLTMRQARERAAQVMAMVLGWQLFEPFLSAAAGFDASDKTRKRLLDDAVGLLMRH